MCSYDSITLIIVCVSVRACVRTFLTAGLLDRLYGDDAVCGGGVLHSCGLHPDDSVGQGQAPQLLKGVPRLSNSTLLHTPLHPLESSSSKMEVAPRISLLKQGAFLWPLTLDWILKCVRLTMLINC